MLSQKLFDRSQLLDFIRFNRTPIFNMDMWLPCGTDIRTTLGVVEEAEEWIRQHEGVSFVTASVGMGAPRFFMTYMPEQSYENFAQLQVRADSIEVMHTLLRESAVDDICFDRTAV